MSRSPERRLRFSVEQDLQLLREVVRQNPFEDMDRWREVHENFVNECNVPFSLRTCKDHCNHLLNLYLKDSLKVRPKESPSEFSKKKKYLDEILEMRKQAGTENAPKRGPRSRYTWEEVQAQVDVKTEPHSRQEDSDDDDFFWEEENERDKKEKEREAKDMEAKLRKQELALEERKLALKELKLKLEQERFELDRMEQTRRMEMEKAERDMYRRVVMQNQTIITSLMDIYNKRNGGNLCIL